MKAIIQELHHTSLSPYNLYPSEKYVFCGMTDGPERREVSVSMEGYVIGDYLFKQDEADWEYELEIIIKRKPKNEITTVLK